jgi:hypothetical protein
MGTSYAEKDSLIRAIAYLKHAEKMINRLLRIIPVCRHGLRGRGRPVGYDKFAVSVNHFVVD